MLERGRSSCFEDERKKYYDRFAGDPGRGPVRSSSSLPGCTAGGSPPACTGSSRPADGIGFNFTEWCRSKELYSATPPVSHGAIIARPCSGTVLASGCCSRLRSSSAITFILFWHPPGAWRSGRLPHGDLSPRTRARQGKQIAAQQYGLDKPLSGPVLGTGSTRLVRLDFDASFRADGRPVAPEDRRAPPSRCLLNVVEMAIKSSAARGPDRRVLRPRARTPASTRRRTVFVFMGFRDTRFLWFAGCC